MLHELLFGEYFELHNKYYIFSNLHCVGRCMYGKKFLAEIPVSMAESLKRGSHVRSREFIATGLRDRRNVGCRLRLSTGTSSSPLRSLSCLLDNLRYFSKRIGGEDISEKQIDILISERKFDIFKSFSLNKFQ